MSLTPDEHVGVKDDLAPIVPDEVLEGDRASVLTGMVVARAWRDDAYRQRLLDNPTEVLRQEGLHIPDGMSVRAFADTDKVRHLHINSLTTEPEEVIPLFREMFPLPEGSEVRLIQNTAEAVCLVIPVAPPEPEVETDSEILRKLAPRASVWAVNVSVVENLQAASNVFDVALAGTELEAVSTTTTALAETQLVTLTTAVAFEAEAAATTTTAAAEAEVTVAGVEFEAAATTTTVAAEGEVVAVAAIVLT